MGLFIELSAEQKSRFGLPTEQKLCLELIPPENKLIVLVSGENPFFQLGVMRVGDKFIQVQELSKEYLKDGYRHIKNLAASEGFPAHAKAVEVRIKKDG